MGVDSMIEWLQQRTDLRKRTWMGILVVAVAALAALVFLAVRATQIGATAVREPVPVAQAGIPPIDANQPAHTETATFAEG
jgi:hypothetical protein